MDKMMDVDKGIEVSLSGGLEFHLPPATLRSPNLTPDMETGIGKLTDAQLVRALRQSVSHNNKVLFPLMPFQNMSDADIVAVI